MPADRLLSTLLRSLQTYTEQQDTPRLLSTAAAVLTTLTNPLNITLLTSQLLIAPAIWNDPQGLHTCLRVMSVFHSAATTIIKHELADLEQPRLMRTRQQSQIGGGLSLDEWTRAVIKGADERSPRWKHLLVIGGLLIGFKSEDAETLPARLGTILENAMVQATNISLAEGRDADPFGLQCVVLVLNHSFQYLSDMERARIDYDQLLPLLMETAFFSAEGLESGYFLGAIDLDVRQIAGNKFNWPAQSQSFGQLETILGRPLVSSFGPLSRLLSHAVEHVSDAWLVQAAMNDLAAFSRTLLTQWRNNKLSEVDSAEENMFLSEETIKRTSPTLWRALKLTLFSIVIVLRGVVGRLLLDPVLASDAVSPSLAIQVLHVLRNTHFIADRLGTTSFSEYRFVYLAAIDVLSAYSIEANAFLHDVKPLELGQLPVHPLDRNLDLYFLNTAEHFTLCLPAQTNEDLLVAAATPYLGAGGNNHLLPIFEAAHSVMLAVLSTPQSADLAAKHLPFYVDALFKVFPHNLSPRQFRLAYKTLLRVTSPPSILSEHQPVLPATLLELLHHRALHAPTELLAVNPSTTPELSIEAQPPLSEQSALTLTLLDTFPFLALDTLEEWLPLAADLINAIKDEEQRDTCRRRFWEVFIGGEMDSERSQICVAWWTTRGGRERVLFGEKREEQEELGPWMSGALPVVARESKL